MLGTDPRGPQVIGNLTVNAVDARGLHAFLGVARDFPTWIKSQIDAYGFVEHRDFEVFPGSGENPQGGRPTKTYMLSLDMAKELAMVSRTAKGPPAGPVLVLPPRRRRRRHPDRAQSAASPIRSTTVRPLLLWAAWDSPEA